MMQRIEMLNGWFYSSQFIPGMESDSDISGFCAVQLPHTNVELPYNYFDEKASQIISCYKHFFQSPPLEKNQAAVLQFEGVMTYAKVYINGHYVGDHKGGYTPFSFPVQEFLSDGAQNELTVVVDSTERADIPPFGGQIDYLTYGGIYREVSLDIYEPAHILNAKIQPLHVLDTSKGLEVNVSIENALQDTEAVLEVLLSDKSGRFILRTEESFHCPAGQSSFAHIFTDIEKDSQADPIRLWTLDDPALYKVALVLHAGTKADRFERRIGFRTVAFKPEGFFLNGERVQLIGLNRHQSWPYVGNAMPKRAQQKDADILKYELHLNLVRTSHYPQSIHFLDRCDEIGLLVFEEIPGWQHIGDDAWKAVADTNVSEMIERDWNHPSIMMWGVRINESADDHDFYTKTNRTAHSLDTTRPTAGVRYISDSELLEDVYTYNNFNSNGLELYVCEPRDVTGLDYDVPYMITEYCGHMYPTKKYDCEERQAEHVSRHLLMQNGAFANPKIAGAIGWCAFDYNTHKDFGAGDRICYHGVMDMFRISKFAGYVYASQVSPAVEPVLEPVTFWARGERCIGGILPLIVLSNCDYITIQYGSSDPIKLTRKSGEFGSLPYPPFIIGMSDIPMERLGEWGMRWEDGKIRGYVDSQIAIEKNFSREPVPTNLVVIPDDKKLEKGHKDVTRVYVGITDQMGSTLPFIDSVVKVSLEGPGRIQGPDTFAVKGGSFGFYVETCGDPGTVKVLVASAGFEAQKFEIEVC